MRVLGLVLIATACSAPPHRTSEPPAATPAPTATPAPAPGAITWTRIWTSDVRKIDGRWTAPSLHQQRAGEKLTLDVAVAVASANELTTSDVAVELYAGARRIACSAPDPLGFTETGSITAQASVRCENPTLAIPTRVVVIVRGVRETFETKLTSLTTPV